VFNEPQILALDMLQIVNPLTAGEIKTVANPIQFVGEAKNSVKAPPKN